MIDFDSVIHHFDCFQDIEYAHGKTLDGLRRLFKRKAYRRLTGEKVNFIRFGFFDNDQNRAKVLHIHGDEIDLFLDAKALEIGKRVALRITGSSHYPVPFGEEQLGQIGTILTTDTTNKG
jgi:hypothetical protein